MRYRIDQPVFTQVVSDVSELNPHPGSLYITGESSEARSGHLTRWDPEQRGISIVRLQERDAATAATRLGEREVILSLRSTTLLGELLGAGTHTSLYLDITGLPHHIWAPLVRALRSRPEPAYVVYVEPGDYRPSSSPTDVSLFDLSEKIEGISPLPGFLTLTEGSGASSLFVPLLGFEGARFSFMLENVQPQRRFISPVIGVPGFRPEYPFYAYIGNRLPLAETRSWQNVRFAAANCPFSLYQVLEALSDEYDGFDLKVGLIGTKPHALGAVLYYLDHPNSTELLYDHPVRKPQRTQGTSRVCVYDLSLLPPFRPDRGLQQQHGEAQTELEN